MEKKTEKTPKTGGLYSKINMSVKSANVMVASLLALLVIALIFVVKHNGFTVKFETDGGSYIAPVRAEYSDKLSPEVPTKGGGSFTGWYTDRDCTESWDSESDTVQGSMTLYAGWDKVE